MSRFAGMIFDDVVNGLGLGAVLFTQYCPHRCEGCHNSETWSKDGGSEFTIEEENKLFEYFKNTPFSRRLTISGGEPCHSVDLVKRVIATCKKANPNLVVWMYTGYLFEDILNGDVQDARDLLSDVDVLVDGKFIKNKRDVSLNFRGSNNQRIIDVRLSLTESVVLLHECHN